jgi:hypothetical protein
MKASRLADAVRGVGSGLERWLERWEIRSPRLAILRLHEVFGWAIVGSLCSFLLAPWFAGTSRGVGAPMNYLIMWLFASLAVALRWTYQQWRDRPALPPQKPSGVVWSTLVSTGVLATILLSVTFVGAAAADREVRGLRGMGDVRRDMRSIRESEAAPIVMGPLLYEYDSAKDDIVTPRSIKLLSKESTPLSHIRNYVPDRLIEDAVACSRTFPDHERFSYLHKHCRKSYVTTLPPEADKEEFIKTACILPFEVACGIKQIRDTYSKNTDELSAAHKIDRLYTSVLHPEVLLWLVYLAVILGVIAGGASAFPVRLTMAMSGALTLLALLASEIAVSIARLSQIPLFTLTDRWVFLGWAIYAVLLVITVAVALRQRARSGLLDFGVLLLQLWPLFVVVMQWRMNESSFNVCNSDPCTWPPALPPHLYPYATAVWTLFTGLFVSRYRALPYST